MSESAAARLACSIWRLGLRAFSGITVGLIGSIIGVHSSLTLSALALAAITCLLWIGLRKAGPAM